MNCRKVHGGKRGRCVWNKLKMGNKNRIREQNTYRNRYEYLNGEHNGEFFLCVYCGDPADTIDHVPPLARVHDYISLCGEDAPFHLVKSCRECNNILGESLQEDFIERIDALKEKLTKRHRKALRTPEWHSEDIEELGPNMRAEIESAIRLQSRVSERIDYAGGYNAWIQYVDRRID